jgi:hypothetical protein
MIALKKPETTYIPMTLTRRYAVDMPYADPFKGTPYGERNGPAVAVVGAVGSIGAGAAIVGTNALIGGLMIAGGIASAVGAITGNEALSTLGMGLSLAGGIGTAFVNSSTGAFMNPFAEGANFSDTIMGSAFTKMKGFFSGGESAADALGYTGQDYAADYTGVVDDISADTMTKGLIDAAPKTGVDIMNQGSKIASSAGNVAGKSSGLLGSIGENKDLLNLATGLADGYSNYRETEAIKPLRDAQISNLEANADATNFNTQLAENRYNNMQGQPSVEIGVNPNAQVFNQTPGTAPGKYAVVMNGEVKYVNQAEYDALRANQSAGGGLLPSGVA